MKLKLPQINGKPLSEFIKVEPDVSFGSFGAMCMKCNMPLNPDEYVTLGFVSPTVGYVTWGYTTDKHDCRPSPLSGTEENDVSDSDV